MASSENDKALHSSSTDPQLLHDLRVFHEVARTITSSLDRAAIVRAVMAQMERFFRPECWSLLLADRSQRQLTHAVLHGQVSEAAPTSPPIPFGEGMAGWAALHGEPLIVSDFAAAPESQRISAAELAPLHFPVHAAISIPLRSRGRTVGVLQLFNYRLETLNDYAMTFLHILTDYAAIAIDNAEALQKIQELTITDDCTRLYNTRHLHAALQTEFDRSRRFGTEFSIIFMDLDYFKRINDQYGHMVGTELLVEVAQLTQSTTRSVDTVFRYGGDEFVILLPQTGKVAAIEVAQRLRQILRMTVFLNARSLRIQLSASFGVSSYPQDGVDPAAVLQTADTLMYSVKHSTRDNVASTETMPTL